MPLREDESGNIVISPHNTPVISLNRLDSDNRRRFTCAHEIGHYIQRSQESDAKTYVDFRSTLAGMGIDEDEIFANQFAAALLMPASQVLDFFRSGWSPEEMARSFRTSTHAMELRLRNLQLG